MMNIGIQLLLFSLDETFQSRSEKTTISLLLRDDSNDELLIFYEMWKNYIHVWRYYGMHLACHGQKFNKIMQVFCLERFKMLSNRKRRKLLLLDSELNSAILASIIEIIKNYV